MDNLYKNILDFTNRHNSCPFCKSPLDYLFTNYIGFKSNGSAIISSSLSSGLFYFNMKNYKINLMINAENNLLEVLNYSESDNMSHIKNFLEQLGPHVEAYCTNDKCDSIYSYSIRTDLFRFKLTDFKNKLGMNPFIMDSETFIIDNFWIKNDWIEDSLKIYKKNDESGPVIGKLLKLNNLHADVVKQKIMTLISFY